MPKFSPHETGRALIQSLRQAYNLTYWFASQQNLPVETIQSRIDAVSAAMKNAAAALAELQTAYTNTQIATKIAEHIEPAPADLPAAYTAARNAVNAMLDDYGTNVLPLLPAGTWNAVDRVHVAAVYNIDTPANFKTNLIAARDALEVFN